MGQTVSYKSTTMQTYQAKHRVAFSPLQMFDLVAKVEDYPQFLPLCEAIHVRSRETRDGVETIIADMSVGYGPIHETFTSKVTLERAVPRVLVEYLDGPFSHLENRWLFQYLPEDSDASAGNAPRPLVAGGAQSTRACDVEFYIAYEFRSPMLQMLMGAMFETAFTKFVDAFVARAEQVYGVAKGDPVA